MTEVVKRIGVDIHKQPKYKKPEEMIPLIDGYFEFCDNNKKTVPNKSGDGVIEISDPRPYTVPDLALALGFADKQSLHDYARKKPFTYVIKRALGHIEAYYNRLIVSRQACTGPIFLTKAIYGYRDNDDKNMLDGLKPDSVKITFRKVKKGKDNK
jgi:hypothetical protein